MAKPRNRASDLAVYLVIRVAVCVVQAVPPAVAFWLADRVAWLVYRLVPSRRRVALDNLTAAYPELAADPARADRLVRAMYRHFVRAVVECLLLPRKLHVTNWRAFADLYPAVGMPHAMFSRRPTLFVTAHFGNWEMAGHLFGRIGFKTYAIARVLDNPHLERLVLRLRQATGQTVIAKKDDFERLTAALRAGGKVATLADQDAGSRGVFVEFFGRPASTHKAVALMAMEFNALMVVTGTPRVGTRSELVREVVIDPSVYANHGDAVKAITQRYHAALER